MEKLEGSAITAGEVIEKLGRARAALAAWQTIGVEGRLKVLSRCAVCIRESLETLTAAYVADGFSRGLAERFRNGLLLTDGDRLRSISRELTRVVAHNDGRWRGEIIARRADGVVLIIAPNEVPAVGLVNLLEMLLVGNAVLLRVHRANHVVRVFLALLVEVLTEARLSTDIVQVLVGSTRTVLDALIDDNKLDTVVFFGAHDSGEAIAARCYAARKKFVLELDASDSVVAWADADPNRVVGSVADGFNLSGAPCLSPRRVLCHPDVHDRIVQGLTEAALQRTRIVDDPSHGVLIPMSRDHFLRVRAAFEENAKIVIGGEVSDSARSPLAFMSPLVATTTSTNLLREPIAPLLENDYRAPAILVIRCDGDPLVDILTILRRTPFHNRLSIWTEDCAVVREILQHNPETGFIQLNCPHVGDAQFGGLSGGRGRSGGAFGESLMFWHRTSAAQTIRCENAEDSVLASLGATTTHGTIVLG